ncbi:hypothetical protein OG458_12670 [Streptomyces sp. NBC_01281]|uniref:hypothetical protein n=1 Tax=Streptomyces sp. NBC_01281 TaxID=2903811 RepID=UPI002E13873A|nr:hypothetical protein OG458_12670 [Streptomyces sp. NBC_01281]
MSDIRIDFDVLDRVRRDIKHIGELMEGPGKEMDEVDGESMGVSMLAARMNDFGDEWSYGIKQIKKFSGAAVKELDKMKRAFEQLDDKLDDELRKSREKHT